MCVMWRWIEVRCTILQCNFSKFPFKAKSKQTHKKYWHWQVPPRDNSILELEVFYHYFIRTNFKIRKFQCPDSRLECCYVDRSGDCRHTVHSTSMWRRRLPGLQCAIFHVMCRIYSISRNIQCCESSLLTKYWTEIFLKLPSCIFNW